MIRLFTGLPGSFKTCHAVRVIKQAVAAGRPVYVTNIEGLNVPGVELWEDPSDWEALPQNALLVVDEAQKYWRASRDLKIPPEIQALETHRHKGIDFLLTTQQPGYLLKHLRGLVGEHVHHIRTGKMRAKTLTYNRCCEDLTSAVEAKKSELGLFIALPEDFTSYVSTVQDTHKPRLNRRTILLAVAALAICTVFGVAGKGTIWGKKKLDTAQADAGTAAPAAARFGGTNAHQTSEGYTNSLRPRHAAMPWSAPVFDDRQAVAQPEVYCMASMPGLKADGTNGRESCTCITEQGTGYAIEFDQCRLIASHGGTYNPYRDPRQQQVQQPSAMTSSEAAPVVAAVPPQVQPFGMLTPHGGMGVGVGASPR